MKYDKPRGWILADDALRELAERLPANRAELERIRTLPPAVLRKRGDELLALIERGRAEGSNEPEAVAVTRPAPEQLALVTKLMAFVRDRAQRLQISPEVLATRRDIERLVFSGRADRLSNGWRREVIGEPVLELARRSGLVKL